MRNSRLRVVLSIALVAIVIYLVRSYRSEEARRARLAAVSTPFRSTSPSSEGTKSFAWIPEFPGATLEDITSRQTRQELSYGFRFRTTQDPAQTLTYYETHLRPAGFAVVKKITDNNVGGALHAEDAGKKRQMDVNVAKSPTGAEVSVMAAEK